MAAEVDSIPSPPNLLPSELELEREAMSTCQVDVMLEAGQASGQQQLGEMSQGSLGAAEVSIKLLMSSKVSGI